VQFQYEPIAAAFDYERSIDREQIVLVADIGGGTSDFSVVRVGPERAARLDRKSDILANHGVHVAGTDFDRRVELMAILPQYGYGAYGPVIAGSPSREVPSGVYFDLATWHLINTVYSPGRVAELRGMRKFYGDPAHYERLMVVVDEEHRTAEHGAFDRRAGLRLGAALQVPQVARDDVEVLRAAAAADVGRLVDQVAAEDALHRAHQATVEPIDVGRDRRAPEGPRRAIEFGPFDEIEHGRRHRRVAGLELDQAHAGSVVGNGDGGVGGPEVDGTEHCEAAALIRRRLG
jgi:hypothetical protein